MSKNTHQKITREDFNRHYFPGSFTDYPQKFSSFIEGVEWALLMLDRPGRILPNSEKLGIKTFDGSEIISSIYESIEQGCQGYLHPGEVKTWDLDYKINQRIFRIGERDEANSDKVPVSMTKIRSLTPPEYRSLDVGFNDRKMNTARYTIIEYSCAWFNENEEWVMFRDYWASDKKRKNDGDFDVIIPLTKIGYFSGLDNDALVEHNRRFLMLLSMQFTKYYQWYAYVKESPSHIGFKIPIAPGASKDIFSLRDIPEGKKRRKAIVNYVKKHYRTGKNDLTPHEKSVLVRKHFRGENKFNWRGLEVHIIPSDYDLNKIKTTKRFLKV